MVSSTDFSVHTPHNKTVLQSANTVMWWIQDLHSSHTQVSLPNIGLKLSSLPYISLTDCPHQPSPTSLHTLSSSIAHLTITCYAPLGVPVIPCFAHTTNTNLTFIAKNVSSWVIVLITVVIFVLIYLFTMFTYLVMLCLMNRIFQPRSPSLCLYLLSLTTRLNQSLFLFPRHQVIPSLLPLTSLLLTLTLLPQTHLSLPLPNPRLLLSH